MNLPDGYILDGPQVPLSGLPQGYVMDAANNNQPEPQSTPQPSIDPNAGLSYGEQLARQAGLSSRDMLNSAMTIPNGVGDLVNPLVNKATDAINLYAGTNIPQLGQPGQTFDNYLTQAGLPSPNTPTEQKVQSGTDLLGGLLAGGGENLWNDVKTAGDTVASKIGDLLEKPDYPTTQADAEKIANHFYKKADDVGGQGTPQLTNKVIDASLAQAPQTLAGKLTSGDSPLTQLSGRWEALRDQPLTLQGVKEMDQGLSRLIDKEVDPQTGWLSQDGYDLKNVQNQFRSMVQNPSPGDIEGGQEGFQAYKNGVDAWHQSAKMGDIERIQLKSKYSDNPSTVIKNQTKTLLSNPANTAGWSDDEIGALENANERGVVGTALNTFGSKLGPWVGTVVGEHAGGIPGAAIGSALGYGTSSLSRMGATALQNQRLAKVLDTLGQSVPKVAQ